MLFELFNIPSLLQFFTRSIYVVVFDLFVIFGWTFVAYWCISLLVGYWLDIKGGEATEDWEWKVFAIDIPRENIQTPKAVEQMFAHLAGALEESNIAMRYWRGHAQRGFSFEIVSIEGYIQFLIRTEAELQDMVESAVHAQYPDVEIVEVEDYVENLPDSFPDEKYDMWATDFSPTEKDVYPIRTYEEFEHNAAEDEPFKDPMSAFLESFSKVKEGEQLWFQIVAEPTPDSWKKRGINEVKELIGEEKESSGGSALGVIPDLLFSLIEGLSDHLLGRTGEDGSSSSNNEGPVNKIQYLTPGQKRVVESIEDKISKIGFDCKVRGLYVAEKEVFREHRGIQALIGAVNQFNVPSANSLKPKETTDVSYFLTERREKEKKESFMSNYKKRKKSGAASSYILNIEELATLWHFPMSYVKTPMVQKAHERKAEPPSGLPVEGQGTAISEELFTDEAEEETNEEKTKDGGDYSPDQKFG